MCCFSQGVGCWWCTPLNQAEAGKQTKSCVPLTEGVPPAAPGPWECALLCPDPVGEPASFAVAGAICLFQFKKKNSASSFFLELLFADWSRQLLSSLAISIFAFLVWILRYFYLLFQNLYSVLRNGCSQRLPHFLRFCVYCCEILEPHKSLPSQWLSWVVCGGWLSILFSPKES